MTNPQNNEIKTDSKNRKGKKALIITLCSFTALLLAAVITATSIWLSGKNDMTQDGVEIDPADSINVQIDEGDTVIYEGKKYKFNNNITTVLCMGIDNAKNKIGGEYITGRAGQADAIYLIAVDTATGKTTVLGIPRDSMVDVDIYTASGTFAKTQKSQICLAYAYGDGKDKSAQNTAKSVSRLLYGMPVNSYFAVDDKSIPVLHNAVGPITVTPNETIKNGVDDFKKGVPVTLTGNNVFRYLQTRTDTVENASLLRLERQTDYLKKYTSAVITKSKKDFLFPVKLYNKVTKNAVTDLDVGKVTYLATTVLRKRENITVDFVNIPGEQKKGNNNLAEFTPNENELFEAVLNIFYKEV